MNIEIEPTLLEQVETFRAANRAFKEATTADDIADTYKALDHAAFMLAIQFEFAVHCAEIDSGKVPETPVELTPVPGVFDPEDFL